MTKTALKYVDLTDNDLIDKFIKSGQDQYFEALYVRYRKKVLDKCYNFVKNRDLAEELVEDIFSKTFEKLGTFKKKSSFSSWLYSVTYNHCIDYLRDKKRLHYPNWNRENELPDVAEEPETLDDINYENLLKILELVHPEEKALLLMKYQDELSIKEIGAALRITENATKMRLKRAKTRVAILYSNKFLKS